MDKSNLLDLQSMKPEKCRANIQLIGAFGSQESDVPDPHAGTIEDYEMTYTLLNQFCDEFVDYFVNKHEI